MSLRLKINLIVAALTLLFAAAVLALQLRSMRESVHEEVVAANLVFGLAAAWTVTRFRFPGRRLLSSPIELPLSISPVHCSSPEASRAAGATH